MEKTLKQGTPGDPIPRPEHPKPQFARKSWLNLNGYWDFEIDNGRSGTARGLSAPDAKLQGRILVPFCPESGLSGVGHKDFMYGVWYQRRVSLTPEQCAGRVFLHFGACSLFIAFVFILLYGVPAPLNSDSLESIEAIGVIDFEYYAGRPPNFHGPAFTGMADRDSCVSLLLLRTRPTTAYSVEGKNDGNDFLVHTIYSNSIGL